ncbi:MAG: pirin family protein [Owenweeksia sp.]
MKSILYKANSRGHANHGWLNSYHTFSFAEYHNPERTHFGVLRVFNDDTVDPGTGFGAHPHANMEIVSIPLSGALEHRDSTGRHKTIQSGEVQIMSAGKGIVHSEYNASKDEPVSFLQIWIIPEKTGIDPRYEQKEFDTTSQKNSFINVVAPDNPAALWINQNAWFYLSEISEGESANLIIKNGRENGLFLFVIEGEIEVENQFLETRDSLGLSDLNTENVSIKALRNSKVLAIELKMKWP